MIDPLEQETADRRRLGHRLLHQQGVEIGALMVPHAEAMTAIAAAAVAGADIEAGEWSGERVCRVCGCSDLRACRPEPCWWAEIDLCSACAPYPET